jgi:5-methylcytosine-specific restriction endonuclease McrA
VSYRCRACRQYHRDAPYRRINLGAVCSEECLSDITRRPTRHRSADADIPPQVREAVLARDRHRCRYCGRTADLHLHHIHYRSEGVDHRATNLITLCGAHHDLIHSNKRRWQPVCEAYVRDAQRGRLTYLIDRSPDPGQQRADIGP